ncbi:hypothetical protein [Curtobacterium sp. MCPF17_052]|uniref:hypothetical protein n=1 Tax=Curtobacterium sp. MCPF17_052 TaxID=2175655 RepID=UPI0024DFE2D3|nr:hypothetical protein [Curtobacterium sp. MCPF17_052]WIB11742.1 hypothetical protein DEJ36_12655 [Curtobacterium sp. MCPF17_052]
MDARAQLLVANSSWSWVSAGIASFTVRTKACSAVAPPGIRIRKLPSVSVSVSVSTEVRSIEDSTRASRLVCPATTRSSPSRVTDSMVGVAAYASSSAWVGVL